MSRDHRKLQAFQLADALVLEVYRATKSFPRDELFGMTSQMRRSSVSVAANIVEGCGREGEREFSHFLSQAFASLRELGYYFHLAKRLDLLEPEHAAALELQHAEASRVLASLVRAVRLRAKGAPLNSSRTHAVSD